MEIKITKRELLKEVNNDMCHNYYWLVKGRIYNDANTYYRRFHFVEWFDLFDVQEYFEAEDCGVSTANIKEYLNELIWGRVGMINSYDHCDDFFAMCNNTINAYNNN